MFIIYKAGLVILWIALMIMSMIIDLLIGMLLTIFYTVDAMLNNKSIKELLMKNVIEPRFKAYKNYYELYQEIINL